eukprot:14248779-Alexandrium_andersonii.AAC.1
MDERLWHFTRSIASAVATDTQQLEGINSMVKHMTKLSPDMSLRSKDDRRRLVRFAIENHAGAKAIVDNADRFAVVEAHPEAHLSQPSQHEQLPLGDTD